MDKFQLKITLKYIGIDQGAKDSAINNGLTIFSQSIISFIFIYLIKGGL